VQAVEIPAVNYDSLSRSYRLEDADLYPENRATASGGTPALVAALWGAVRRTGTSQIMVLHHRNRSWVAAGHLLIEGSKGLNIGFLMPALRAELGETGPAALPDYRPDEAYRKVIWALAARMSRVEAERVYLLDTGDLTPILVSRDGFALTSDLAPDGVRAAVASATQAGHAIRYSLGDAGPATWGPVHPVAALFGDDLDGSEIRISSDLWPQSVPATASLADVQLALTLVEALMALEPDPECRLQVLGAGSRPILLLTNDADVWAARIQSPGVTP
jgi:hypothetical protein